MRIGFIGCAKSSEMALRTLLDIREVSIEAVVTQNASSINTDFVDLGRLCESFQIPCHYGTLSKGDQSYEFLKQFSLDIIYCIGWSYLLNKKMLSLTPKGVIGFHPAKLPQNRGRHPIIWTLTLGLSETASTFFKMDVGADSGPILSQRVVPVSPKDTASTLYSKIMEIAKRQINEFTIALVNNDAVFEEQDESLATYWRKRTKKDGLIDWRMSSKSIHNLIRALVPPYPGAEFLWHGQTVLVSSSKVVRQSIAQNIEPGKVIEKDEKGLLVKCAGTSSIWLLELSSTDLPEVGEYL